MITEKSTLREVYQTPMGRDILDRALAAAGRSAKMIQNPIVGRIRLASIDRLVGKAAPGVIAMLTGLLRHTDETPPPSPASITHQWWKEAVFYQIYPRSFQDSDGDGIGDINGIRRRIPYLKELGVDAVWLSPIYDSPDDDMGYDIRDYRKIMDAFGSMADFDAMLDELHQNGIRLLMDLVVNHTSDEHPWFQKALADPESPEHGYYIFAPGRGDGPPNNWVSIFSGPAWNHYPELDEWALHVFSAKQMDLNWDNPALRGEIIEMVNWWLDKGVDGFRLDAINFISKGSLADGNDTVAALLGPRGIEHYFYGPRLHEYLRQLRREAFEPAGAFSVGEADVGLEMSKLLSAEERGELDMVFNFDHLDNPGESRKEKYRYNLCHLKPYFLRWQMGYGNNCWQSLVFENHDNPRMISKIDPDPAWRPVVAKLLATLQFTLKGTPFLYQGQELGMTNCGFDCIDEIRDVETLNRYRECEPEQGAQAAFERVVWGSRDHARTPMQWDGSKNAGFTTGEPWLRVNPNYPAINAEAEQANPDSIYNFFKRLIELRREYEALVYGQFCPVFTRDADTFCYFRIGGGKKFYVEINLTGEDVKHPGPLTSSHQLLTGNYGGASLRLRPYEANLYRLGAEESVY